MAGPHQRRQCSNRVSVSLPSVFELDFFFLSSLTRIMNLSDSGVDVVILCDRRGVHILNKHCDCKEMLFFYNHRKALHINCSRFGAVLHKALKY